MISVVLPTYCERQSIRPLFDRLVPVLGGLEAPYEVLVMDDRSPDGTADEVSAAAQDAGVSAHVRCIVRSGGRGLAAAVLEGFAAAQGDIIVVMDADLSHAPEVIPALLEPLLCGEVDITVASRRVPGGGVDGWSALRRLGSWSATLLARPVTVVRDATAGFFAFQRGVLDGVQLEALGYKVGLELWVKARGARIREIPLVFTDRVSGKSKAGVKVSWQYLRHLLRLYRYRFLRGSRR